MPEQPSQEHSVGQVTGAARTDQDAPELSVRFSSGTHRRSRGPVYCDWGRIRRFSRCCSRQWAIQPAARLIVNVGVKSSSGISSPCSSSAV